MFVIISLLTNGDFSSCKIWRLLIHLRVRVSIVGNLGGLGKQSEWFPELHGRPHGELECCLEKNSSLSSTLPLLKISCILFLSLWAYSTAGFLYLLSSPPLLKSSLASPFLLTAFSFHIPGFLH